MATIIRNPAKEALRKAIQEKIKNISSESRTSQSEAVTQKVLASDAYCNARRVSIYLSTSDEINTMEILRAMFCQGKQVFVPTYYGNLMEMVRLYNMDDYTNLPTTKWNIKQPNINEDRENALDTGGLDLLIMPGVAFSKEGGRLGHGRGYYDTYIQRFFDLYPKKFGLNMNLEEKVKNKRTILMALAFQEQIVEKSVLPLDPHDFPIDVVVVSDIYPKADD